MERGRIAPADGPSRRALLRTGAAVLASGLLARPLRAAALLGSATAAPACAPGEVDLPVPDLADSRLLRFVAGLRPYRRGGIRLELETLHGKPVVHHYGHGGAGVTLSWGGAELAADLVAGAVAPPAAVAVLGAGAVGLATARVLLERGFAVHVYAADFPPQTTSDLAGAEWLPFGVDRGATAAGQARFAEMTSRSWRRFAALASSERGAELGIERRTHYDTGPIEGELRDLPPDTIGPPRRLDRVPFPGCDGPGLAFDTFLIEPPRYLPALLREVLLAGAVMRRRQFGTREELRELAEPCLVNCTGLGAATLFDDRALTPVRGQLVHLFPQPLPWLLSSEAGYCFPRRDAIVLGGTYERGVADPTADAGACRAILERHRRFFAPEGQHASR